MLKGELQNVEWHAKTKNVIFRPLQGWRSYASLILV